MEVPLEQVEFLEMGDLALQVQKNKNEVSQNSNKSHLTPGLYRRELACKGVLRPYQGLLDQAARQGFGKPPGSLNQKEMLKI